MSKSGPGRRWAVRGATVGVALAAIVGVSAGTAGAGVYYPPTGVGGRGGSGGDAFAIAILWSALSPADDRLAGQLFAAISAGGTPRRESAARLQE